MKISYALLGYLKTTTELYPCAKQFSGQNHLLQPKYFKRLQQNFLQRRCAHAPADHPDFISVVDHPAQLVSTRRKQSAGIIILALIPITSFVLGTWQVVRLGWKTDLIARFEDRLIREPLPLPPYVDPTVVADFDYRRVYATGRLRHDQEILIGPRVHEGEDGYIVITPLERGGEESKILISRGWISKSLKKQADRKEGLPHGNVIVSGLLRAPFKKNIFTPDNKPENGEWYFPDLEQMAQFTGSQPVWIEETMRPDLMLAFARVEKGIPIGRPAEVNLRNNHTQYIFTWYALSFATTIMLWMVLKKPPSRISGRVRQNREW